MHRRLPFSNDLPCEAGNDLAQTIKVDPFKGALVEALPDDQLGVGKSGNWVVKVLMIVTDLLQSGAEDGMFWTSNSESA